METDPSVVTLRAWTMWGGEEAEAFQATVDAFNASHPGLRVRNLPSVDDPKIVRAIVANDPPDFFTLREPSYLGSLAANGALRSLDADYAAAGLRESDYAPGSLSQCRFRGKTYAALFLVDCIGLLWNKDLFRKAGLDPERPPRTMEQLLDYARKLTVRDRGGRIMQLGLRPPEPPPIFGAFGGEFADGEGMPRADGTRMVKALEWYGRVIEAQGDAEEVNAFAAGFGQDQGANNPFLAGKVAMAIEGQWNTYWFQRYGPNVRYGAAPMPRPDDRPDLTSPSWLGGNLFCIPSNSRHQKEAWEFLRWTQTREAQVLFASKMHGVPNLLAAQREPSLRTGEAWKREFAVFMDAAASPNSRHFPVTPVSGLYQKELITAADFVRFGTRTPEEALRGVQGRVLREARQWQ